MFQTFIYKSKAYICINQTYIYSIFCTGGNSSSDCRSIWNVLLIETGLFKLRIES